MSYKDVLCVFKLERELTDDETATLNTLRAMTPADIEATVETFGGSMGKQASKSTKAKTTRNIKHCTEEGCGLTKRARIHKDAAMDGYHWFQSSKQKADDTGKKSARASSLASAIKCTASSNHQPLLLCDYEIDGRVCHGEESDGIHDKSLGYGNYHPFVSSSTAPSAVGQLSTKDNAASSKIDSEDVSVAAVGGD